MSRLLFVLLITGLLLPAIAQSKPPSADYKLTWSDEFDGTKLDESKWGYHGLGPRRDAINVKECATLDGKGKLVLTTKKVGDKYHTAMVETRKKYEARYGYYECRAKLQTQLGHWSAFWLHSPKFIDGGDPKEHGTEIDIFEYLTKKGQTLVCNLHWGGYKKGFHKTVGSKYDMKDTADGFHTFGLEWTPKEYVIYLDGKEVWRTTEAISHIKQYIILSLEVGEWAGDIKDAKLPDSALFDYVRVYQIPAKTN